MLVKNRSHNPQKSSVCQPVHRLELEDALQEFFEKTIYTLFVQNMHITGKLNYVQKMCNKRGASVNGNCSGAGRNIYRDNGFRGSVMAV